MTNEEKLELIHGYVKICSMALADLEANWTDNSPKARHTIDELKSYFSRIEKAILRPKETHDPS